MNNGLKYLYSSGDSFSTPGTKKDYETDEVLNGESFKSYADIISEKNNLMLYDDAKGGGGNDMIMRKFMRYISYNPDKIDETLFIINWSYSDRLEYLHRETRKWNNYDKEIGMENVKSKLFNQEFLVNYFTDGFSFETKFRIPIFYLYHFLHGKGAKFLFSSTPGWEWKKFKSPAEPDAYHTRFYTGDDIPYTWQDKQLREYDVLSSIDKRYFTEGIQKYLKKEHHQSYIDEHPNELGHKRISELIISKLNDIYNLNLI